MYKEVTKIGKGSYYVLFTYFDILYYFGSFCRNNQYIKFTGQIYLEKDDSI